MASDLSRLNARMNAIPKAVREAVTPALVKGGDEFADRARQLAETSRDTGDLIASITVTGPGQSTPPYSQPGGSTIVPENTVMITVGNGDVRYPHLVEYGTKHAAAQPFFWPAWRLTRKRIQTRIARSIGKAVRDGWAKP